MSEDKKFPIFQGGDAPERNAKIMQNYPFAPIGKNEAPCLKTEALVIQSEMRIVNEAGDEKPIYSYQIATVSVREEFVDSKDTFLMWHEIVQSKDYSETPIRFWKLFVHMNMKDLRTGGACGEVCLTDDGGCSTYRVKLSEPKRATVEEIKKLTQKMHWIAINKMNDGQLATVLFKKLIG